MTARPFRPPWWLRNPHLQTLAASVLRPLPRIDLGRERLLLPDGDSLELDWTRFIPGAPFVIVLHGLEGSARSRYAAGILKALSGRGFNAVLMYFRGCGGVPNRYARGYHAGETEDLTHVVRTLRQRYPGQCFGAVGYSLGGNVLLKWLGETGADNPLDAAVAVSVPFRLADAARRIDHGFSKIYQRYLLRKLEASIARKQLSGDFPELGPRGRRFASLRDFDDAVTAPLHGFNGVDDYYARSSSIGFLNGIARPTLLIHALDDPFMYPETAPTPDELPPAVRLELSPQGGHVGFVSARGSERYWLEARIPAWFERTLR